MEKICTPEIKDLKPYVYDTETPYDTQTLENIWEEVKIIYLNAKECSHWSKDENAWSDDVVRPVLRWGDTDGFFEVLNM